MPEDVLPLLIMFTNFLSMTMVPIQMNTDEHEHIHILFLLHMFATSLLQCNPPVSSLSLHNRLFPDIYRINEDWSGRDVFLLFSQHRYEFWLATGETPETFNALLLSILPEMHSEVRRRTGKLSPRNRLLLTLIWLRQYPLFSLLSLIFDVSVQYISRMIEKTWILLWQQFAPSIVWHNRQHWEALRGNWPEMQAVVGAIDGTSHEILIPTEEQELYYSGHRKYHCLHTQVIIDNLKNIVYVHSGFLGHENDANTYRQLPEIGPGMTLDFPPDVWFLGDSIYPCRHPVVTPYKATSFINKSHNEQNRMRKYNRKLRKRRIYVEHVIKEIKVFRVISNIYRHQRCYFASITELCAGLAKRRVDLFKSI